MRAGLSTIQQTLTPEAAAVLNQSIAEAGRRSHGQTTPLHVAATLLSSPAGYLRQACIKSHPNSSHPLQCRALELCFSVALERLPSAAGPPDPPISNALMAALKRAQAHQRRGCPEQQQQPLLAVKVELEQLIISILDDPSVSRVMREASFSSPAVKAAIEQSLTVTGASPPLPAVSSGFGFRSAAPVPVPVPGGGLRSRSLYVNPKLQRGPGSGGVLSEDVKKVVDILMRRGKKRNPVLVGEAEPEMVVKEVLRRVEGKELGDVRVCRLEKEEVLDRIGELVEESVGAIIFDLGDLKWLVEQPVGLLGPGSGKGAVGEAGRAAVAEVGKVLGRHRESGRSVWLIGTATCETYLRCQVYHPTMENDWDLQAVPIAARNPVPGMFPRFMGSGLLGSSVSTLSPLKGLSTLAMSGPMLLEKSHPVQITKCCPQCKQNYEHELAKITPKELDKSPVDRAEVREQPLPQWLRNAKPQDGDNKDGDQIRRQKILELQKKWQDNCAQQHPGHHQSNIGSDRIQSSLSLTSLCDPITLSRQPFVPKMQLDRSFGGPLHLNRAIMPSQSPARAITTPASPVETDLALGRPKETNATGEEGTEEITKDFLGLAPPKELVKLPEMAINKLLNSLDKDSFKRLLKGLLDKVPWQQEAAASVTTAITHCKMGSGKPRGGGSKGDIWLLFTGPDKVGKKKMASALSELICGTNPIMVSLGSRRDDGESDRSYRGKTALDQIVDAVKRNPFSVIMLEGIDEADMLVRGSIKRAIERGRLADSYGREISFGNVIFILTANWLPDNLKSLPERVSFDEKKLTSVGSGDWQLKLLLGEKTAKRRAHWLDEDWPMRPKKEPGLTFDLNETANIEDDKADGSHNSSDLTIEREEEPVLCNRLLMPATSSISRELVNLVDDNIVFKPVDFGQIRCDISGSITKKFATVMDNAMPVEIQEDVLEKIAGSVWLGRMGLEEWSDKVLVPSIRHLKMRLPSSTELMVVRLETDNDSPSWRHEDILPCNIRVVADGFVGKDG